MPFIKGFIMTNKTTNKTTKQTNKIAETRKAFFDSMASLGISVLDMGTKRKVNESRKVLLLQAILCKQTKDKLFNLKTIQKEWNKRIKDATKRCANLSRKECDLQDLYLKDLQGKGKIKSGALIGKVELGQAIIYAYFRQKRLFTVSTDIDGNFNIKEWDYIENLLEEIK